MAQRRRGARYAPPAYSLLPSCPTVYRGFFCSGFRVGRRAASLPMRVNKPFHNEYSRK